MRKVLFIVLSVLIYACGNSDSKTENTGSDTVTTTNVEPQHSNDTIFTAFGNEPFWALYVIRDQKLVFHPMDGPDVEVPYAAPTILPDNSKRYSSAGDSATIELNILEKDCSDGMSDLTHRFETNVKVNAVTYRGCGRE